MLGALARVNDTSGDRDDDNDHGDEDDDSCARKHIAQLLDSQSQLKDSYPKYDDG